MHQAKEGSQNKCSAYASGYPEMDTVHAMLFVVIKSALGTESFTPLAARHHRNIISFPEKNYLKEDFCFDKGNPSHDPLIL